jgi:hypothetical protein
VIGVDGHPYSKVVYREVLTNDPINNLMTNHLPKEIQHGWVFDREVVKPYFFEVGVLRSGGVVQELTTKMVITEAVLPPHQLLKAKFFREDRGVWRMFRTATTEGTMRKDVKLRLMLTNVRVKVCITPSITDDKLVIL